MRTEVPKIGTVRRNAGNANQTNMKDKPLDELLQGIKLSIIAKAQAERAIVGAEQKMRKANCEYNLLIQALRAKEYTIE